MLSYFPSALLDRFPRFKIRPDTVEQALHDGVIGIEIGAELIV